MGAYIGKGISGSTTIYVYQEFDYTISVLHYFEGDRKDLVVGIDWKEFLSRYAEYDISALNVHRLRNKPT